MTRLFSGILILYALCLSGCGKTKVDCDYTIHTVEEAVRDQKPYDYSGNILVFAYNLDAEDWEVASYEDALQGVVTSKVTGAKAGPDFIGAAGETGIYEFNFTQIPVMLVVCHTEYPAYGWRDSGVVANLARINIQAAFRIWKYESKNESDIIKEDQVLDNDAGWKMVYISTWEGPVAG